MDDELKREPEADELEDRDEVEATELDDEDLDDVSGGDPGTTHPDTQAPYIP